jgi:hypothetical protein
VFTLRDLFNRSLLLVAMAATAAGMANATPVFSTTVSLTAADPTQLGRLSRNGVPTDWSTGPVYPGSVNAATSYHYKTFDLDVSALEASYTTYGQFLQISIDSIFATTFLGAYLDSYNPLNLATNYLGDPGTSGNSFGGTDPLFYQVSVASGHHLVLVFNETTPNGGLNQAANILVEAFTDTEYTDLTPRLTVPEPATFELALLALAGFALRRKVTARSQTPAPLPLAA